MGNRLVEICGKPERPGAGVDARLRLAATFGDTAGSLPQALSACSACAGNYEDPDRTAWTPDVDDMGEVEDLDDSAVSPGGGELERLNDGRANGDKFPARET